jgi:mono/diheme cytochrome c family protein
MPGTLQRLIAVAALLAVAGCAGSWKPTEGYEQVTPAAVPDLPDPAESAYPAEQVDQGRYLVEMLGCGNCHTDGALIGEPNATRLLAGSAVGIAWSNPLEVRNPGVVYPSNLTPDRETGIGDWSVWQIVAMLQSGVDTHGGRPLAVMPRVAYSKLRTEDATAIAMYLKSLPAVEHKVPANVGPGRRARSPFVHFGVYRSRR